MDWEIELVGEGLVNGKKRFCLVGEGWIWFDFAWFGLRRLSYKEDLV